jgi:hypothetical protein
MLLAVEYREILEEIEKEIKNMFEGHLAHLLRALSTVLEKP